MFVLATVVCIPPQLLVLRMDHNPIGDDGARAISAGLAKNMKLNTLSLSYCGIKEEGALALAKALSFDVRRPGE